MISMISVFKTQSNTFALYSPYFFLRITNSIKIASKLFCRDKNGLKSAYPCAFRALYIASKTACRGFKSFCPCHDDGLKNGLFKPFLRLFFLFLAFSKAANISKILDLGFIWGLQLPNTAVNYQEILRMFAPAHSPFFYHHHTKNRCHDRQRSFCVIQPAVGFCFCLEKISSIFSAAVSSADWIA